MVKQTKIVATDNITFVGNTKEFHNFFLVNKMNKWRAAMIKTNYLIQI